MRQLKGYVQRTRVSPGVLSTRRCQSHPFGDQQQYTLIIDLIMGDIHIRVLLTFAVRQELVRHPW